MKEHTSFLVRFLRNPLGFARRALYKTVVGPIAYAKDGDYDAGRFWGERFKRYGASLKGPGDEGLTEEQNLELYRKAEGDFAGFLAKEKVSFAGKRVMEIGCGTGFFTRIIHEQKPASFTGVDITDVLFAEHRQNFPGSTFVRKDASVDSLEGTFDVVAMIDVIQHIVTQEKFDKAMCNVREALVPGGVFLLSPIMPTSKKHMFYVHSWNMDDVKRNFPGFSIGEPFTFRSAGLIAIRKPA